MSGTDAPPKLANTVIAGVNKAGTTSLFVSLSTHPEVAPAEVKETEYFLPARWGEPLDPVSVYASYFRAAGDRPVRLEATPAYFYGGTRLARTMADVLGRPVILLVLREPVARFVSFFEFQKARLRLPETMTIAEYSRATEGRAASDFCGPDDEVWFGYQGGCYADYLPDWFEVFDRQVAIVFFEHLVADPARELEAIACRLGIDPAAYPTEQLSSENRTTAYRNRGLQRVALGVNDRFERFLRRHHGLKQRLRAAYYRVNGSSAREAVPAEVRAALARRYEEPNARLRDQLRAAGVTELPNWLGAEPGA